MKFTLDGGISAYEFEDEKEPENQDQLDQLKALMGGWSAGRVREDVGDLGTGWGLPGRLGARAS